MLLKGCTIQPVASLADEVRMAPGSQIDAERQAQRYSMPSFFTRYRKALKLIPRSFAAAVLL